MSKENAKKLIKFMLRECGEFSQEDMASALKDMQSGADPEFSEADLEKMTGGRMLKGDGLPLERLMQENKLKG